MFEKHCPREIARYILPTNSAVVTIDNDYCMFIYFLSLIFEATSPIQHIFYFFLVSFLFKFTTAPFSTSVILPYNMNI